MHGLLNQSACTHLSQDSLNSSPNGTVMSKLIYSKLSVLHEAFISTTVGKKKAEIQKA